MKTRGGSSGRRAAPAGGARAARKVAAMRAIQAVALDLIEAHGFTAVTMERIASAAGVGVASVYRYFGTKERVVLWDEYDPLLLQRLARRRPSAGRGAKPPTVDARPVLEVVEAAVREGLASFYATDARRILRRSRLVVRTPALRQAMESDLAALRGALAEALARGGATATPLEAAVAAGAVVACLHAATDAWVRGGGRRPLDALIAQAFQDLRALAAAPARRGR